MSPRAESRRPSRSPLIPRSPRSPKANAGRTVGNRPLQPDAEIERAADAFGALLSPFFDLLDAELRRVFAVRADAVNQVLAARVARARAAAERSYLRRFGAQVRLREAERFVAEVDDYNRRAVDESVRSTGTQPVAVDTSGTRSAASDAIARSMEELQHDVMRQAALIEQLERALADDGGPPDLDRLGRIIADRRGAAAGRGRSLAHVALRRFNADLTQMRMRAAGLVEYVWGPTESAEPRELHERYRGQTFQWSSPPDGGHPGELWACKCVPIPIRR